MSQETMLDEMGVVVNRMIALFEKINPMYKTFFANNTERNAVEIIISQQGESALVKMLAWYEKVRYEEFCPRFTKPTELLRQWGKLIDYWRKKSKDEGEKVEAKDYSGSKLWENFKKIKKSGKYQNWGIGIMCESDRDYLLRIGAIKETEKGDVICKEVYSEFLEAKKLARK